MYIMYIPPKNIDLGNGTGGVGRSRRTCRHPQFHSPDVPDYLEAVKAETAINHGESLPSR